METTGCYAGQTKWTTKPLIVCFGGGTRGEGKRGMKSGDDALFSFPKRWDITFGNRLWHWLCRPKQCGHTNFFMGSSTIITTQMKHTQCRSSEPISPKWVFLDEENGLAFSLRGASRTMTDNSPSSQAEIVIMFPVILLNLGHFQKPRQKKNVKYMPLATTLA